MTEEPKIILNSEMDGLYRNDYVWVSFEDETRKFYEKSYYGTLYNEDLQEIRNSFQLIEVNEKTKEVYIAEKKIKSQKRKPAFIVLHPLEALYLIERKKLTVWDEKKGNSLSGLSNDSTDSKKTIGTILDLKDSMSFNELLEQSMNVDPTIWQKYIVYRDIRHRGYIIRVGYGGKADFRVYARGAKFAKDAAKFVFFIIRDGVPVALNELDSIVNQVLGDRKQLILAIFDKLGDSTFYQLENMNFKKIGDFEENWNQDLKVKLEDPEN